jgi:hypothetical protein
MEKDAFSMPLAMRNSVEAFDLKMVPGAYMSEESIGTNAMAIVVKTASPFNYQERIITSRPITDGPVPARPSKTIMGT